MVAPDLLRSYPFFAGLSDAQLAAVARLGEHVRMLAGEAIFFEGEPADAFHLVLEGEVALYHDVEAQGAAHQRSTSAMQRLIESGANVPLLEGETEVYSDMLVGTVTPGHVAGISALIEPHRYAATGRALRSGRLVRLDARRLRGQFESDPALGCALLQAMGSVARERLRAAREQLVAGRG
jgi:CRP-like cAMP-binding protein